MLTYLSFYFSSGACLTVLGAFIAPFLLAGAGYLVDGHVYLDGMYVTCFLLIGASISLITTVLVLLYRLIVQHPSRSWLMVFAGLGLGASLLFCMMTGMCDFTLEEGLGPVITQLALLGLGMATGVLYYPIHKLFYAGFPSDVRIPARL